MNRLTGAAIDDDAHLAQSIGDILTTRVGSRLARREYGSNVPDLIDEPFNGATVLRLYAATVMALLRWEPRIRLTRINLAQGSEASMAVLDLEGTRSDSGTPLALQVPLAMGASA